jgi:outer membrane biogenesis lipoprotein LolB
MSAKNLKLVVFLSVLILVCACLAPAQTNEHVSDIYEVMQAQQALSDLGYYTGDVNGLISSDTQEAIRQFQWFNNLPVTGNLDGETNAAIDAQERGIIKNEHPIA